MAFVVSTQLTRSRIHQEPSRAFPLFNAEETYILNFL